MIVGDGRCDWLLVDDFVLASLAWFFLKSSHFGQDKKTIGFKVYCLNMQLLTFFLKTKYSAYACRAWYTLNMKPYLMIWPVTSLSANTNHALIPWISSFCGLTWGEIGRHAQWSLRLPSSGQLSQTVQTGGTARPGAAPHTLLEKQQGKQTYTYV